MTTGTTFVIGAVAAEDIELLPGAAACCTLLGAIDLGLAPAPLVCPRQPVFWEDGRIPFPEGWKVDLGLVWEPQFP